MHFRAIGIDGQALGLSLDSEAWSEESDVPSVKRLDVCIMPLQDEPFWRGKCGYKFIQYTAYGLPMVASPVGENPAIVQHGVNGFIAATLEEWEQAMKSLATDPTLRRRMGDPGRGMVEGGYFMQIATPRLAGWLIEAAKSARD
jgi:glycosyltransferase involved in cell wall biosynthesis